MGNNAVSLLAATMIFGIVFATLGAQMSTAEVLGIMRESGPAGTGLTFIWMPQLFAAMPLGKPPRRALFSRPLVCCAVVAHLDDRADDP